MKKMNMGHLDKIIRLGLGSILLAGAITLPFSIWRTALFVGLGLILWGTAFVRFCPIYNAAGLSTCERKNKDD